MIGQQPVIVRIVEQPVHQTGIVDIIIGSLGLVGALLLAAALLGLALGGILIGLRKLRERSGRNPPGPDEMRVTPSS